MIRENHSLFDKLECFHILSGPLCIQRCGMPEILKAHTPIVCLMNSLGLADLLDIQVAMGPTKAWYLL